MVYKERGYKRDALLIPGWALDYKILENMALEYNFIIPETYNLEREILPFIKGKILILGHSLGGFLGFDFACKHPKIVKKLILVGIRKKYRKEEIFLMRKALIKDKEATLYSFYRECFNRDEFLKFKNSFLSYYLKMDEGFLLDGLGLLLKIKIEAKLLKRIENVTIIHSKNDRIAPLNEAAYLCEKGNIGLVLMNFSHIPFLNKGFLEWIKGL